MLGDVDIADLWVPFFCVSTNLTNATLMVHDRGPLVDALRASIAIPGVLPPVPHGGDLLVDGGLLDNVPVDEMRRRNPSGRVLAIDVAPVQGPVAARDYGLSVSGTRSFFDRRRGQGPPHLVSTMVRATLLASVRDRERVVERDVADLYLDVGVEGGGLLDFSTGAAIVDAAATSTRPVLERWIAGELAHLEQHHIATGSVAVQPPPATGRGGRGVALLTLRDLQYRIARVSAVIVGTAVVLTLLFLMSGLTEQFHREPRDTIAALGADRWMVREGATGAFTSAATMPDDTAAAVDGVDASPMLIGRHSLDDGAETLDVVVIGYEPGGVGEPDLPPSQLPDGQDQVVIDDSSGLAIGDAAVIGGTTYEVTGTTDRTTMNTGMPVVFMPIEAAQALVYRGQPLASAVLLGGEPSEVPEGFHTLTNEEIAVDAMRPLERSISSVNLIRVLLWFVAAMIIGTMTYLAALERLRDMAVLKAIGASTRQLATSIAVQGALITLLATLMAAVLQVFAVGAFPLEVSVPARALWQVPLIAVVVAPAGWSGRAAQGRTRGSGLGVFAGPGGLTVAPVVEVRDLVVRVRQRGCSGPPHRRPRPRRARRAGGAAGSLGMRQDPRCCPRWAGFLRPTEGTVCVVVCRSYASASAAMTAYRQRTVGFVSKPSTSSPRSRPGRTWPSRCCWPGSTGHGDATADELLHGSVLNGRSARDNGPTSSLVASDGTACGASGLAADAPVLLATAHRPTWTTSRLRGSSRSCRDLRADGPHHRRLDPR